MPTSAQPETRSWESRLGSFDRRIHRRVTITLHGLAFSSPRRHLPVSLLDISQSGCRLRDDGGEFEPKQWLTVSFNGEVVVEGIVRWWNDNQCGVEFLDHLPSETIEELG